MSESSVRSPQSYLQGTLWIVSNIYNQKNLLPANHSALSQHTFLIGRHCEDIVLLYIYKCCLSPLTVPTVQVSDTTVAATKYFSP